MDGADIVTALVDAGLVLEVPCEYPYSNGGALRAGMRALPGGLVRPPEDVPASP